MRVEDANVERPLQRHQQQGDGDYRSTQHHDQRSRVVRPAEQRQPTPGHAGRSHAVNGDDEVQAGEDGGEAGDENTNGRSDHVSIGVGRAERRIEGPAGIDATGHHGDDGGDGSRHVDVPAQQVNSRERQVLGADHQRNHEIADYGGHRGDQEEEHHDDPVHREQLVIGVGRNQIAGRRQQLQADQHGKKAADPEHGGDRDEVQHRDTLMV